MAHNLKEKGWTLVFTYGQRIVVLSDELWMKLQPIIAETYANGPSMS